MFAVWFDAFVYNQIWEDPEVDIEALELDSNSRVLTISSGGCNAMNYLLCAPERVHAVDLNSNHIHLLNLKIAAVKAFEDGEDFFRFFGFGKGDDLIEKYDERIARLLPAESRMFWESAILPGRRRIRMFRKGGLYQHSRNGYFLRFFHRFANLIGCYPDKVLEAKTPEEQQKLFEENIEPFFESFFIRMVGKMPVTLFGLGIPPQQYEELKKDLADDGSIIDVYRARAKKLAVEYPIDSNYFSWQAFARKYDTENLKAVPEYLKPEKYAVLRDNINSIDSEIGSVTQMIADNPVGTYNRFVFLDAQDWMDGETLSELWGLIAEKGELGSRVIFRTAGAKSPVEYDLPSELRERFEYFEKESLEFFERDRASIYGGFHLYRLKGD